MDLTRIAALPSGPGLGSALRLEDDRPHEDIIGPRELAPIRRAALARARAALELADDEQAARDGDQAAQQRLTIRRLDTHQVVRGNALPWTPMNPPHAYDPGLRYVRYVTSKGARLWMEVSECGDGYAVVFPNGFDARWPQFAVHVPGDAPPEKVVEGELREIADPFADVLELHFWQLAGNQLRQQVIERIPSMIAMHRPWRDVKP